MVLGLEQLQQYLPEFIQKIQYNPISENLQNVFWAILILIILHLLKPKPQDKTVPSIMFFIKEGAKSKRYAFMQRLFNNLLFFLQLLIILLAIFAIYEPFTMVKKSISADNTVLVIDASASMESYIENTKEIAKKNIQGDVSIIMISDIPLVLLERGEKSEAESIIDKIQTHSFGSAIGESIRIASEILGKEDGRILVLSDFINTEGVLPQIEKEKAISKGQIIDFINVAIPESNVGLIDMKIDRKKSIVYIKNFNFEEKTVTLNINGNQTSLTIPPRSIDNIDFNVISGMNTVKILEEDDVSSDNVAFFSIPRAKQIKVLYIRNTPNPFLESALQASPKVLLQTAEPPIITELNHDIYIIGEIDTTKILPGVMRDIEKNVAKGSSVIFLANSQFVKYEFEDIMPVTSTEFINKKTPAFIHEENKITQDITFGSTLGYNVVQPKEGYFSFASTKDNNTLLGFLPHKLGISYYHGIHEDANFHLSPSYPIYWAQLFDFLIGTKDLTYYNRITGTVFAIPNGIDMIVPSGEKVQKNIMFDKTGVYRMGETEFAVNFFREKESDIFADISEEKKITTDISELTKKDAEENLVIYTTIIIIILLIFELIYIKYRGDV